MAARSEMEHAEELISQAKCNGDRMDAACFPQLQTSLDHWSGHLQALASIAP